MRFAPRRLGGRSRHAARGYFASQMVLPQDWPPPRLHPRAPRADLLVPNRPSSPCSPSSLPTCLDTRRAFMINASTVGWHAGRR
eukprot:tig00020531_g10046.t1